MQRFPGDGIAGIKAANGHSGKGYQGNLQRNANIIIIIIIIIINIINHNSNSIYFTITSNNIIITHDCINIFIISTNICHGSDNDTATTTNNDKSFEQQYYDTSPN